MADARCDGDVKAPLAADHPTAVGWQTTKEVGVSKEIDNALSQLGVRDAVGGGRQVVGVDRVVKVFGG